MPTTATPRCWYSLASFGQLVGHVLDVGAVVAHENDQQRRRVGEIGQRNRLAADVRQREIGRLDAQRHHRACGLDHDEVSLWGSKGQVGSRGGGHTSAADLPTAVPWQTGACAHAAIFPHPILAEGAQSRQRFAVSGTICRNLAGDDVVRVANVETFHLDVPPPRILETLDAVRREYQVEIERAILELDKILAPLDLGDLLAGQREANLAKRRHDRPGNSPANARRTSRRLESCLESRAVSRRTCR